MDDDTLLPCAFFATIRVRELLFRAMRPVGSMALARYLHVERVGLMAYLEDLVKAGLCTQNTQGKYALTEEGEASVRWSAPPPPDGVVRARWVTELARAISEHYDVSVSNMLRGEVGAGVVARSRLCFALYARGWSVERIEEHFGLPAGWARRAVERWKRLRDHNIPKTGPELRAWRERLKLTQAQAAKLLGVSRRTVMRSERTTSFSPRMSVGRA